MHALIIEDHFLVSAQIEDILRTLGYDSFDFVERDDDAIDAARLRRPDLITADQRLTTGVAAIREICAHAAIPVVFVTDFRAEVRAAFPDAVIIGKPFAERTLRDAVRAATAVVERVSAAA